MTKRVVYKFEMPRGGYMAAEMPIGAELLHVEMQGPSPQLWALCDPSAPTQSRMFLSVPTGAEFDAERARYIGTVQRLIPVWGPENQPAVQPYVIHVFEIQREK